MSISDSFWNTVDAISSVATVATGMLLPFVDPDAMVGALLGEETVEKADLYRRVRRSASGMVTTEDGRDVILENGNFVFMTRDVRKDEVYFRDMGNVQDPDPATVPPEPQPLPEFVMEAAAAADLDASADIARDVPEPGEPKTDMLPVLQTAQIAFFVPLRNTKSVYVVDGKRAELSVSPDEYAIQLNRVFQMHDSKVGGTGTSSDGRVRVEAKALRHGDTERFVFMFTTACDNETSESLGFSGTFWMDIVGPDVFTAHILPFKRKIRSTIRFGLRKAGSKIPADVITALVHKLVDGMWEDVRKVWELKPSGSRQQYITPPEELPENERYKSVPGASPDDDVDTIYSVCTTTGDTGSEVGGHSTASSDEVGVRSPAHTGDTVDTGHDQHSVPELDIGAISSVKLGENLGGEGSGPLPGGSGPLI